VADTIGHLLAAACQPQSWADHVEADRPTFTYAPSPLIPAFAAELRRRPGALESVHFTRRLPRNASMKVRKDQLREQLTGQPAGEGSPRD
jgi:hypothetical protein